MRRRSTRNAVRFSSFNGDWLSYLHEQGPLPANVIGVPISIDAIDPMETWYILPQ